MERRIYKLLPTFIVIGAVLLLLVAIAPIIGVSTYSHPCADDYTYGMMSHSAWLNTHSVVETIKQAFLQVKDSYYTWQGTHTSIFLMAMSPAVFEGTVSYGLSAWIMIIMLLVSVNSILNTVFVKIFNAPKWMSFFVASITSFWMLESMYSPVNGLFWFNGAVHYWFMHGCMLISTSCVLNYFCERMHKNRTAIKVLYLVLATFMAYFCGGSNYSTALVTGCIMGLCLILGIVLCKCFLQIIPTFSYLISFAISVAAPGNAVRSGRFEGKGPVSAVLEGIKLALYDELHWIDIQFFFILLIILPILYLMARKTDFTKIRWIPIISILISFGLHAAFNIPLFYAMGGGGLARQENICKLWFQLMVVINIFLIICSIRPLVDGAIEKIYSKVGSKAGLKTLIVVSFYFLLMISIVAHMKISNKSIFQYSSYIAYVELRNGEAREFYSVYEERMDMLKSEKGDVTLPEYTVKPYLLYLDDIDSDPMDWKNMAYASWYEVNSVRR